MATIIPNTDVHIKGDDDVQGDLDVDTDTNMIKNDLHKVSQRKLYMKAQAESVPPKEETTTVYYWYFPDGQTENKTPPYSQHMPSLHKPEPEAPESIINPIDGRKKVLEEDYQASKGRFRGIVKLFLLYEGQISDGVGEDEANWAIATGWLIAGDLIVTAGHCAYDYSRNLGRLIRVKAYVGYSGKDSIGLGTLEFQYGAAIATTQEWIETYGGHEPRDLSIIKLKDPFKTVDSYYKWDQTPVSARKQNLGVVGYPGDIMNLKGERGAEMHEMFKETTYDLTKSYQHMLQYQIDTYGGNSGSPVFKSGDSLTVIGVHVLGGYAFNSASVITGDYGIRLEAIKQVAQRLVNKDNKDGYPFDSTQPEKDKRDWLWRCHSKTTESGENDPIKKGLDTTILEALTVSADIPGTILDSDQVISYGSTGPQIAILASAAIAMAGKLAADSVNGSNAESLGNTRPYEGILGRAVLAESALECFLDLPPDQQETFTEFLGPIVASLKPFVMKIAPKILKGIIEPSMRLLLASQVTNLDKKKKRKVRADKVEMDTGSGRKLTTEETVFLECLMAEVKGPAVESFFSTFTTIGDLIGGALSKAGPVLLDVAKVGFSLLLGTESGGLPTPTHLDPLAHRAILAEACLQAYIAKGKEYNTKNGVFANIIKHLADLGPKVVRTTPYVGKIIGPIVGDILRDLDARKKQEFFDFTYGKS